MAFTLDNNINNEITITNNDVSLNFTYTILKLSNDGVFVPFTGYTLLPTSILSPLASVVIDLIDDGIYTLLSTSPDNTYYFFTNSNLRMCEKIFLEKILCSTCECNDICTSRDFRNQLKFNVLKERFYYTANKYIQDQSIVDLISPENAEILYWSDILLQLSKMCNNCNLTSNDGCLTCGSTEDKDDNDLKCLDC